MELRAGTQSALLGQLAAQPSAALPGILRMVEVALRDVNAKVFFAGTLLLQGALVLAERVAHTSGGGSGRTSPRTAWATEFSAICELLTAKLRDRNKRCVGAATSALLAIAAEMDAAGGAHFVSSALMKVPKSGLASHELARRLSIATRFTALLRQPVRERTFSVRQCVVFLRSTSALMHSRQEVRDAARKLLVELALHCDGGVDDVARELRAHFSGRAAAGVDVPDLEDLERSMAREWAAVYGDAPRAEALSKDARAEQAQQRFDQQQIGRRPTVVLSAPAQVAPLPQQQQQQRQRQQQYREPARRALDAPLDDEVQYAGGALPPSRGDEVEDDDATPRFDVDSAHQ